MTKLLPVWATHALSLDYTELLFLGNSSSFHGRKNHAVFLKHCVETKSKMYNGKPGISNFPKQICLGF